MNLDEVKEVLRPLRLQGAHVIAHSSLAAFGNVEGGAVTVCQALMQSITEAGTLLMPAFTYDETLLPPGGVRTRALSYHLDLPVSRGGLQCPVSTQNLLQGSTPPTGVTVPLSWQSDTNTERIRVWLRGDEANKAKLRTWMNQNGMTDTAIADVITGNGFADLRTRIVTELEIP